MTKRERVVHKYDEWIGICGSLGLRVYHWEKVTCKRCLRRRK